MSLKYAIVLLAATMETGDSGDDDLDAYMAAIHQQHAAAVAHSSARSSRGRGRGRTRGAKERLASALSTKVFV